MSVLKFHRRGSYLKLDAESARTAGAELHDKYTTAAPFPHIVIEDFVDASLLHDVIEEFPSSDNHSFYNRGQENLKYQYGPQHWPGGVTNNLFSEFNSIAMVGFLEEMTGIRGLIPDPTFEGGGLHETKRTGRLGIHADFNLHKGLGLIRRINVLIYLNEDWDPSYGGDLELWDRVMRRPEVSVSPVFGRAVVFNTTLKSFHGQPEPLSCPEDRSRRSIALYYYTAPEIDRANIKERTTTFQRRPGSKDAIDWKLKWYHFKLDVTPPIVLRAAKAARDRIALRSRMAKLRGRRSA